MKKNYQEIPLSEKEHSRGTWSLNSISGTPSLLLFFLNFHRYTSHGYSSQPVTLSLETFY